MGTRASGKLPELYISGLLKTESGRCNMERLHEELDMKGDGYQQIQHFITNSPRDAQQVIRMAARKTSDLYACQPVYIIDESAHLGKGSGSVGVARQYAGVVGKVDNCQAGVYSSLVWLPGRSYHNYCLADRGHCAYRKKEAADVAQTPTEA